MRVTDERLRGESGSAVAVAAGGDEFVLKLVPAAGSAIDNQRRLIRMVHGLRRRGYPAPEYVAAGESGGTVFTLQRRLPGRPLHHGPGAPPAPRTRDVVHFDLNPANILHAGGRLSGVVDWNIPFDGAGQGDRGFDIATLLFYTYDIEQTRDGLWERALQLSGLGWTTVYLCHLSLRQVEWSRRHGPGSPDDARFTAIAEAVLEDCQARGA
ncbi:MAG: phosphotransferase [Trebonia sp.]